MSFLVHMLGGHASTAATPRHPMHDVENGSSDKRHALARVNIAYTR